MEQEINAKVMLSNTGRCRRMHLFLSVQIAYIFRPSVTGRPIGGVSVVINMHIMAHQVEL